MFVTRAANLFKREVVILLIDHANLFNRERHHEVPETPQMAVLLLEHANAVVLLLEHVNTVVLLIDLPETPQMVVLLLEHANLVVLLLEPHPQQKTDGSVVLSKPRKKKNFAKILARL